MIFTPNKIFQEVFRTDAYEIDITGGRGRGGSHFATDYFLFLITTSNYFRGYFMRQVHGDIRESLFRDFKDRIEEKEEAEDIELMHLFKFNDSSMSITYLPNGNQIHSKGFRKSSSSRTAKMKSIAGATHIIIEEFEEVEEEDYMKLDDSLRTNKVENIQIIRIWNPPPKNHWILKKYYTLIPSKEYPDYFEYIPNGKHKDHLHIFSTYLDNIENINEKKIIRWEAYKDEERTLDHYITDIKGLVSAGAKGQIFKNWKLFKDLPEDRIFYRVFGADWGGNDPNTVMELNFDKKLRRVYIYEHLYQSKILQSEHINLVREANPNNDEVVIDCARLDKYHDFADAGINVLKANKTKINDDFRADVCYMLMEYDLFIHESALNTIREFQEFKWMVDSQTKEPTNKPEDKNNHTIDAILYATRYYHTNFSYEYNQ